MLAKDPHFASQTVRLRGLPDLRLCRTRKGLLGFCALCLESFWVPSRRRPAVCFCCCGFTRHKVTQNDTNLRSLPLLTQISRSPFSGGWGKKTRATHGFHLGRSLESFMG